jgi:hypothetical protein
MKEVACKMLQLDHTVLFVILSGLVSSLSYPSSSFFALKNLVTVAVLAGLTGLRCPDIRREEGAVLALLLTVILGTSALGLECVSTTINFLAQLLSVVLVLFGEEYLSEKRVGSRMTNCAVLGVILFFTLLCSSQLPLYMIPLHLDSLYWNQGFQTFQLDCRCQFPNCYQTDLLEELMTQWFGYLLVLLNSICVASAQLYVKHLISFSGRDVESVAICLNIFASSRIVFGGFPLADGSFSPLFLIFVLISGLGSALRDIVELRLMDKHGASFMSFLNLLSGNIYIVFWEVVVQRSLRLISVICALMISAFCWMRTRRKLLIMAMTTLLLLGIIFSIVMVLTQTTTNQSSQYVDDNRKYQLVCKELSQFRNYRSLGGVALFLETRTLANRSLFVMGNLLAHLPDDWALQVYHSQENSKWLHESFLGPCIHSGKVILTNIGRPNGLNTEMGVSVFWASPEAWKLAKAEKVLIAQPDAVVCSSPPVKLENFIQYDYVGAPWSFSNRIFMSSILRLLIYGPIQGGNGGFSLRSRSKMIEALEKFQWRGENEDIHFVQCLERMEGVRLAPFHVAKSFAVEAIFYKTPWAVHKINAHLKGEELKFLLKACPDMANKESF